MEQYIGKIVQLIYNDKNKNVSIRNVKIIATGKDKFMAYCYNKKAIRTFDHTRVVDIEPINTRLLGMFDYVRQYKQKQSI